MLKITSLVLALLLNTISLLSQSKEATNWYFGSKAALTFNTVVPTILHNSNMVQREGVSSVSDNNGNLLFYTNGIDVWNKNHQIMPNGFSLFGHYSSTQSVMIVKAPLSNLYYYIFTNDGVERSQKGMCFSIVDLSKDNGLGDVVIKNIQLLSDFSEKLTSIYSKDNNSAWVVTHGGIGKSYYVYEMDGSKIQTPIVYKGLFNSQTLYDKLGYMKFFAGGTKLASVFYGSGVIEISDFNTTTGVISNTDTLNIFPGIYGVEFSPDGNVLFISSLTTPSYIIQVDLKTKIWKAVGQNNPNALEGLYGAIQVGIDGKLYIADNIKNSLSVINAPNNYKSDILFKNNQVNVDTFMVSYGLPNLPQTWYYRYGIYNTASVCEGSPVYLSCWTDTQNTDSTSKYIWVDNKGDTVGLNRSVTLWNVNINQSGYYTVYIDNQTGYFNKTVYVDIKEKHTAIPLFENKIIVCDLSYANLILELESDISNYDISWSNGETNVSSITITTSGVYSVQISDKNKCFVKTYSTEVIFSSLSEIDLNITKQYIDLCSTNPKAILKANINGSNISQQYYWVYNQDTVSNSLTYNTNISGKYYFIIKDSNTDCVLMDSININLKNNSNFNVYLPDTLIVCDSNIITAFVSDTTDKIFIWNNNEIGQSIIVTSGFYEVIVTDTLTGCVETASINVIQNDEYVNIIEDSIDMVRQIPLDELNNNIDFNLDVKGDYDIYLKNGIYFSLLGNKINILTNEIGEYTDTLIIKNISCNRIDMMPIRVENRCIVYITIPNEKVSIGDELCISINIETDCDISNIFVDITLGYDNDVFYPYSSNRKNDTTWEFCGIVLLSNESISNIKILNIINDNPYLDFISKDGNLQINSICIQPLRQVHIGSPIKIEVGNNILSYSATIDDMLEIYNISGQLLYKEVLTKENGLLYLENLINGIYTARIVRDVVEKQIIFYILR